MYFRKKTSGGRAYLQIVESRREGAAVRQQVIATLGRVEDLRESGQLERLLRSGARFADKAIVLDALDRGEATVVATRRIGPALAFERVWEETGCRDVIERLARARNHEFSLERAAFLTVLHRLMCGGSDRAADRWREDYRIDGVDGIELHHLYRTMAWLGEELPKDQQGAATPFAPRCVKDVLEEDLFAARRDLLTTLDIVFMDTTSLYFEGAGGQTLGRRGFSKDHRPDLNQMILAVLLDGDGRPVCTEMWPGNTADVKSLIPAIDRLQRRFRINRVCVVADRGMISAETIAELETRKLLYVLGVRERTDKLVRDLVLGDPAPFVPFVLRKERRAVDYEAKAVALAGRRYVVCRNLDEMTKDAANRATIVANLERQLKKGDKSLVGNKGYRRFLADPEGDGFSIDRGKVEEDAKIRRRVRVADQRPSLAAGGDARIQTTLDRGTNLPDDKKSARHAADLPQAGRDDPRPCRLQLPRARSEEGVRGPPRGRRQRRSGLLARGDGRSRLAHRDRGRAGRKTLPPTLHPAPRSQSRALRPRRSPAADASQNRGRLINIQNR